MYRIIATVFFSFALTQTVFAQTDSIAAKKIRHWVSLGAFVSAVPNDFNFVVSYSLSKGRNHLSLGPVFGKGITMFEGSSSRNQNSKYSINGLSCIYQFKPNPKGKRFDLFFQYEMTYQRFSSQGTHPGVLGTVIPYNGKEWFLVNFIGYGLSIHFLRNFELKHNIGLGYLVNQRTYNGKSADSNLYPISGNTRLSLSYTFR